MDEVFLVASGYDWTCPICGENNHEIETKIKVACQNCNAVFEVEDVGHAWGR